MGGCNCHGFSGTIQERRRLISKIILHLLYSTDEETPDILSLIHSTIDHFDIKSEQLQKETINGIHKFINSLQKLNDDQIELQAHFNIFYETSMSKLSQCENFLMKLLLITSMEVVICLKSLKKKHLEPSQIWWVQEHFDYRYTQLKQIYKVEYSPVYDDKNFLIQYLDVLKQCVKKERSKVAVLEFQNRLIEQQDVHTRSKQHTSITPRQMKCQ